MGRTDKMKKSWQKHQKTLRSDYPCSYQYLRSDGTVEGGNPVNQLISYADEEEIRYESALSKLRKTSEKRRQSSISNLPSVSDRGLDFVEKMIEIDKMTASGSPSRIMIKRELNTAYNRAKNTSGHKGIPAVKQACIEVGLVMAGENPLKPELSSVSEDMRASILTAVIEEDRIESDAEEQEKNKEVDLSEEDSEEDSEESSKFIETRQIWGTDNEFIVWLYAKMINRKDIAQRITEDSDPSILSKYSDIQNLIDISSTPSELTRNLDRNDEIEFTPEQLSKLDDAKQIISDNPTEQDALVSLVNEMSRLEIVDNSGDSDDINTIIDPDESDEESWFSEDIDPTDPSDVPSILQNQISSE
jgi:hypothetical protein